MSLRLGSPSAILLALATAIDMCLQKDSQVGGKGPNLSS